MDWFECKVTYMKLGQSGERKTTESYLVSAVSLTEIEERVARELKGRGDYTVESIRKMALYDLSLDHKSERFYKCKVAFITLDEKKGVEKRKMVQILVQENTLEEALKKLCKELDNGLRDFEVVAIAETAIVELWE